MNKDIGLGFQYLLREGLALFLADADSFLLTREGKHRSRRR